MADTLPHVTAVPTAPTPEEAAYQAEVQRNLRHNFSVNLADLGLFSFGMSFATPQTILPLYVSRLTDSRFLIGLVSAITGAGWYLPQLLTANYVERLPVKRNMVVRVGLFTERLPMIVMAASVFLFAGRQPALALWLFFLTYLWRTLGAGVVGLAWQEMVAKIIPVHYRGRLFGLAKALGASTGILGASAGAAILGRYPFPRNFGICISILSLFLVLAWFILRRTREPPLRSNKPVLTLGQYARRLPAIVRRDRDFALYLLSRLLAAFARTAIGFVTVYATQRWQLSDGRAGFFTTLLLAGETVAYLFAGWFADRRGHKPVQECGLLLSAFAMTLAVLATSPSWMYIVFVALGFAMAAEIVSSLGIAMEFGRLEDRPTYMGLANTVTGLSSALAPLLGGWIASRSSYTLLFVWIDILSLSALAVLHWLVPEPRLTHRIA